MDEPGLLVRLIYWTLVRMFGALRSVQHGIRHLDRRLDGPMEFVHRPIRILGARYMDALVNRKR